MNIKTKILGINAIYIIGILVSVFVYFLFSRPVHNLTVEQQKFTSVREQLLRERVFITDYNFNLLDEHSAAHDDFMANRVTIASFIDQMVNLKKQGESIQTALMNIEKLDKILEQKRKLFLNARNNFIKEVEKLTGETSISIPEINDKQTLIKVKGYSLYVHRRVFFVTESSNMLSTIDANITLLQKQSEIIESEVNKLERKAFRNILIIILPIICFTLFLSFTLANRIKKSIFNLINGISTLANGDLSEVISSSSKDEVGLLGNRVEGFRNELNNSIKSIKLSSDKNMEIKENLLNSVIETSSASEEISSNIQSIYDQMDRLNSNIHSSSSKISDINGFSDELNNSIYKQLDMVEQSSDATQKIIKAIDGVVNSTEENREIIEKLEIVSRIGNEQVEETTDLIKEINDAVNNIGSMVEVINNISDQTNLLAMNAAIEAAHAGDAGKGFAVVADEIRKLSVASNSSSKDISSKLKDIVTMFGRIEISGVKTKNSFTEIHDNIGIVAKQLSNITNSVLHLNEGGKEVLSFTTELGGISSNVKNGSEKLNNYSDEVNRSIMDIRDISEYVTQAMVELNSGFKEIIETVNNLDEISHKIGGIGLELKSEVDRFKTE